MNKLTIKLSVCQIELCVHQNETYRNVFNSKNLLQMFLFLFLYICLLAQVAKSSLHGYIGESNANNGHPNAAVSCPVHAKA